MGVHSGPCFLLLTQVTGLKVRLKVMFEERYRPPLIRPAGRVPRLIVLVHPFEKPASDAQTTNVCREMPWATKPLTTFCSDDILQRGGAVGRHTKTFQEFFLERLGTQVSPLIMVFIGFFSPSV
jgi:hypothetical protein